jgi:hypothetical protein
VKTPIDFSRGVPRYDGACPRRTAIATRSRSAALPITTRVYPRRMMIRLRLAGCGSSLHVDKPHGGGIAQRNPVLVAIVAPRRQAAWRPIGITMWLYVDEPRGGRLKLRCRHLFYKTAKHPTYQRLSVFISHQAEIGQASK